MYSISSLLRMLWTGIEDRLLVERLLNTCLVPFQLSADERMKKLYHLLGTIDDHATKAFIELQKNQMWYVQHNLLYYSSAARVSDHTMYVC